MNIKRKLRCESVLYLPLIFFSLLLVIVMSTSVTQANTIVPYEKHTTRIVGAWAWRIPIVYLQWDWEKSSKVIPWPAGSCTSMTDCPNTMSFLAGADSLGSSTTFNFFEDMINNNEIVVQDNSDPNNIITQTYLVDSGAVTYTVGALDASGFSSINVSALSLTGTLSSDDEFDLGDTVDINFDSVLSSGNIHLGLPTDSLVSNTAASGLETNLLLQFPNSVDPNDVIGYNGAADFGGEFSVVPIPAGIWLFGSGLVGLFGIRRTKPKISAISA